jgi:maleylpyruvate isomerase
MPPPILFIDGCRQSHADLLLAMEQLTDDVARRASRLPGWTVGHVLSHIARNGDSVVRRLEGAARGAIVDQYPGGFEGRRAEIEAGADRSASELVTDLRVSCRAVEAACEAMPAGAWENVTRAVGGQEQPATAVVFSRWREVEVHHVDLGLGYSPRDWPDALVAAWLPSLLTALPDRTDPRDLLAWCLGRATAPELRAWG